MRAVSPQAAPAVATSADFNCAGVHVRCSCSSSATEPATCGVAIDVPSKEANRDASIRGSVEERIWPPGAETSGLSSCPNAVGPPEEKLVITPLRPVSSSSASRPTRMVVRPPCSDMNATRRAPSRFEIIPPGIDRLAGMPLASPSRLSANTIPIAPASRACVALAVKGQSPRWTSATAPLSDPAGSVPRGRSRAPGGPQRRRSTALPSVPTTEPTSTSVWSAAPHATGARSPLAPMNGMPRGPPPAVTSSAGEKTWVFDTAATEIASGAVPGEPTEPPPKSSRSFPAAMTGTTPAAATAWTAATSASFAGSICGPPPEKLRTSMPSFTAASNAAITSGVSATWPIGVGTVKTR